MQKWKQAGLFGKGFSSNKINVLEQVWSRKFPILEHVGGLKTTVEALEQCKKNKKEAGERMMETTYIKTAMSKRNIVFKNKGTKKSLNQTLLSMGFLEMEEEPVEDL